MQVINEDGKQILAVYLQNAQISRFVNCTFALCSPFALCFLGCVCFRSLGGACFAIGFALYFVASL